MQIQPNITYQNPSGAPPDKAVQSTASDKKEWTVLLYLDGNNNIEGDILNSFLTSEEVSEHKQMNMLAQLGRAPQSIAHNSYKDEVDGDWDGVRRYVVKQGEKDPYGSQVWTSLGTHNKKIDSQLVADFGKADMSSKETLADFLKWGIKNYPAKRYMVVLASHGSGFLGSLTDYKSGKHMSAKEMSSAFRETEKETGVKPDVLVMDACLMAQAEPAYEMKDAAKFYVASEDVNFDCYPVQKTMEQVHKMMDEGQEITPEIMAKTIVEKAGEFHHTPAVSAINTEKLPEMKDTVKNLADALLSTQTDSAVIRSIIKETRNFNIEQPNVKPYSDYKDLGDFVHKLASDSRISDQNLKTAAVKTLEKLTGEVIAYEAHQSHYDSNGKKAYGMTVYMPSTGFRYDNWEWNFPYDTNKNEYEGIYRSLNFARETGWDKVIDKFAENAKPSVKGADVINSLIGKGKQK
ncbi:MAG: clostripain-related cysteine peptidase [Firmicutes bacterium]|nr:clostripain-related cysteine peptidase [Bacillota bacterium]